LVEPILIAAPACAMGVDRCATTDASLRLERLNAGPSSRVRLVAVDGAGSTRFGAWTPIRVGSPLLLSLVAADEGASATNVLLLLAADGESMLPVAASRWQLRSAMPVELHALED
jgi:hypothetical protein